jgi:hypothetical protein
MTMRRCDWCKDDSEDYYMILQYEDGHEIARKRMCYTCALVSRKLRFA